MPEMTKYGRPMGHLKPLGVGTARCAVRVTGDIRRRTAQRAVPIRLVLGLLCAVSPLLPPLRAAEPARLAAARMTHGFAYAHDEVAEVPWSVHIVKVDRANPNLELHSALAGGSRFGMTTLREHIGQLPPGTGRAVAALNGDYYRNRGPYAGDPKGLQIMRGELISAPCDWT